MKRIISILLVLVMALALFALSGCKASDGADTDAGDGKYSDVVPGGVSGLSAEVLAALSDSGEVSVYSFGSMTDELNEFDSYFSEVYGGEVKRKSIEWEGWENKFITDFAANDAPDVIYIYSKLWPKAASRGFVYSQADLESNGVVGLDHPTLTATEELAQSNYSFAGDVYALDVYKVSPIMMVVNEDLISEVNAKSPHDYYLEGNWNWNTFLDVCQQVHSVDNDGDGKADYDGYYGWDKKYIVRANAGNILKMDDKGMLSENTQDLKVVNGLQMIKDLYGTLQYGAGNERFTQGRCAMFAEQDYNVASKICNSDSGLSFKWSVVPFPLGSDNDTGERPGGCEAHAIVSSTSNPQGALNYIIANAVFNKQYAEESPSKSLSYWLDDDGDQMLSDTQSKVVEDVFVGVGNLNGTQWDFWGSVSSAKGGVSDTLATYAMMFKAQCESENSYRS